MNWLILLFLLLFVLISAIVAYNYRNAGTRVACAIFLIIFGLVLFGGIEYKTGEAKTTTYDLLELSHNATINNTIYTNTTTTGSLNETVTNQYTTYNNYILNGLSLTFVLLGFVVLLLMEEKEYYEEED